MNDGLLEEVGNSLRWGDFGFVLDGDFLLDVDFCILIDLLLLLVVDALLGVDVTTVLLDLLDDASEVFVRDVAATGVAFGDDNATLCDIKVGDKLDELAWMYGEVDDMRWDRDIELDERPWHICAHASEYGERIALCRQSWLDKYLQDID